MFEAGARYPVLFCCVFTLCALRACWGRAVSDAGVINRGVGSLHRAGRVDITRLTMHSNLTRRRVRQVRGGMSLPSLTPLVGVTHTLKMHLNAFLSSRRRRKTMVYQGRRDRSAVDFSGGTVSLHARVHCRSLSGSGTSERVRPFVMSIRPARRDRFSLSSRRNRRFVCIVRNTIRMYRNGGYRLVGTKSDVCCSSVIPRRMRKCRKRTTGVLTIVCAPV